MLQIFDVDHGFAALYTDRSGTRTLFDCGHSSVTGFRPSSLLRSTSLLPALSRLYVSHADEDHVSDLPQLHNAVRIEGFYRNRSIPTAALRAHKQLEGPIRDGVAKYLELDAQYTAAFGPTFPEPSSGALAVNVFHNDYPAFTDTNNLSLVAFASIGGVRVVFPGDLEKAGWLALLADPLFRYHLSQVNVFVASHHGRESGYCPEVFDLCHPQIVVISDAEIQFLSQETSYSRHASGVRWESGGVRRVLTTRRDGHITVTPGAGAGWRIETLR